jgi:hypothetical protein
MRSPPIGNQSDAIRKDLPLEPRIAFSHPDAKAFKFRARGARREVRVAADYLGKGALPNDVRLAVVTTRMFDEYFTGWKPDREARGEVCFHCAYSDPFRFRAVVEVERPRSLCHTTQPFTVRSVRV